MRLSRTHRASLLSISIIILLALVMLYPIWLTVQGGFESSRAGTTASTTASTSATTNAGTNADGGGHWWTGWTLYHVKMVFADPMLRTGLLHSLGLACSTTLISFLIALPLAMLSARFNFPGKSALGTFVLVPMILPAFVGAIGLQHLLGTSGAVNALLIKIGLVNTGIDFIGKGGFWAVTVVQALYLFPIFYLNVTAALANLDPALEEAAENLGAGWWRRFFTIVLPLVRPGAFAGGTIVFIWAFTELGTPLMFDYQVVTPVQIFNGLKEMETSKTPYALTAVMLGIAIGAYVLGKVVLGGRGYAMYAKASVQSSVKRLGGWKAWCATGFFTLICAIAVLPHLSVILVSLSEANTWYGTVLPAHLTTAHYEHALSHELAVGSIRNSLVYSTIAVGIDIVIGLLIGYVIVRTRARGRHVLDAMSMLPLAVPGLVMAFGYVAMSLRWPFRAGDPLEGVVDILGSNPNPVPLLILAYAVRRLPYVVRSAVAGLEQTSPELEEAALNLGAGKLRAVRTVVLPLIMANIIAGGLLAFSFAMLEVSDSLILAQREAHFPITKAIYVLFERLGDGKYIASAMGVWGMALLAVTLVGAGAMIGKKMGAIFRV